MTEHKQEVRELVDKHIYWFSGGKDFDTEGFISAIEKDYIKKDSITVERIRGIIDYFAREYLQHKLVVYPTKEGEIDMMSAIAQAMCENLKKKAGDGLP